MKHPKFNTSMFRCLGTAILSGTILFSSLAYQNPAYSQGFPDPDADTTVDLQVVLNGKAVTSENLKAYISEVSGSQPPQNTEVQNIHWIKLDDGTYQLKVMISTPDPEPIRDLTGDGKIDLQDALRALQIVSGVAE